MAFASLTIDLNARLARFEQDMGKITHVAERNAKQMDRAFAAVSRTLALFGSAIAGGAIIGFTKSLISGAAALDDFAEKTGASVEEASKLEQVARISGTALETVETAMVQLTKRLFDNGEEAREAANALAALGLEAQELQRMDTAVALKLIADEMAKFGDNSSKTALAVDLFGRSGANVLPFLKDFATETGIASRVTAEQAARAEELEKSIRRLGNSIRVAAQAIALDIIPFLDQLAAQFSATEQKSTELQISFNPLKETLRALAVLGANVSFVFKGVGIEIGGIVAQLAAFARGDFAGGLAIGKMMKEDAAKARAEFDALEARLMGVGSPAAAAAARDNWDLLGKPLLNYSKRVEDTGKKLQAAAGGFEDYEARVSAAVANAIHSSDIVKARDLAAAIEKLDSLFFDAGLDAEIYEAAMRKLTGATDNQARAAKEAAEEQARLDRLFAPTNTARAQQLQSDIDFVNRMEERGRVTAEIAEEIKRKLLEIGEANQEVADEMTEFWRQAAHNMQDAVADQFFDLMQGRFDDLGTKFKTMIDRMVANLLASQLLKFLTGDFGKTGELGGVVGDIVKSIAIPKFQEGTPFVPQTMLAVVHRGERIVPAAQNRPGAAGNVYQITLNVHGVSDAASFRANRNQIAADMQFAIGIASQRGFT